MDLDRVRRAKATFDGFPECPEKQAMRDEAKMASGFLAKGLPALPDSDRAAVALFISELLEGLRSMPVSKISNVMIDSSAAYGLAAIDLLGWNEQ